MDIVIRIRQLDRHIVETETVTSALVLRVLDLIESDDDAGPEQGRLIDLTEKLIHLRLERAALDNAHPLVPLSEGI